MEIKYKIKNFFAECKRVFRITKKPTKDEYFAVSKVSAIGILIMGLIGFIFLMITELLNILIATLILIVIILASLYLIKTN